MSQRWLWHFLSPVLQQVVLLAAAVLPALSLMLPGSLAYAGVGLAVTSRRSSVNRGEHMDEVLHSQQRSARQ